MLGYFALQSVYDKHLGVEFQSEIRTLAQVEHLNLVKFYGYLEHGDERIVVVEYVPNGTLREHLDCELFLCDLILSLWLTYVGVRTQVHTHGNFVDMRMILMQVHMEPFLTLLCA